MYAVGACMFFKKKNTIINATVLKMKADRIAKKTLRGTKKAIKRGELPDAGSFKTYLHHIDGQYSHLVAEVQGATMIADYATIRSTRMAETGQLIAFYDPQFQELRTSYRTLESLAKDFGRSDNLKQDIAIPPGMDDLRATFNKLNEEPNGV